MEPDQTITREQLAEIHNLASGELSAFMFILARNANSFSSKIELSQDYVDRLFKLSDEKTRPILLKYLKENTKDVDVSSNIDIVFRGVNEDMMIAVRDSYELKNKSFWLSGFYNWEIKKDSLGSLCLIPTKSNVT